jgi:hypothetical protein
MKKIENYEEFKELYLINHKYYKDEDKQEKDTQQAFKRYIIYTLDDNYYFMLDNKPTIDNTLYYDDETPEPDKTIDYFINYNLDINFKYDMNDYKKEIESLNTRGCCSGSVELHPFININYYNSKEVYPIFYQYCGNSRRDKNTVRDLTPEEVKQYFDICDDLRANYIERLKKYFAKYNSNISTYGYWANR